MIFSIIHARKKMNGWKSGVLGDFILGPNHVLPNDKTTRFSSAILVTNFMKSISVSKISYIIFYIGIRSLAPVAEVLARFETQEALALSASLSSEIYND